jgi:hypothetical protein
MSITKKNRQHILASTCIAAMAFLFVFSSLASAQTIIDEWATVKAPPPPALKGVTIEPKTTALLLLDFNKQTCNSERRPRCVASIPKVANVLKDARERVCM